MYFNILDIAPYQGCVAYYWTYIVIYLIILQKVTFNKKKHFIPVFGYNRKTLLKHNMVYLKTTKCILFSLQCSTDYTITSITSYVYVYILAEKHKKHNKLMASSKLGLRITETQSLLYL